MVQRGKVADERGRLWVSGALPADQYFAEARRLARERAQRSVSARLARLAQQRAAGSPAR